MSDSDLELSIVMPCLNEARTLPVCIHKAQSFLHSAQISGEIIIADNGSSDGSAQLAEQLGARVIQIQEKGYGAALAGGIAAALGRYVIMADADDSYDFLGLMPILEELRKGTKLVVGNRFKGGIKPGAMPFLNRYLGNPVLSFIGRLFFNIRLRDFHCGLRGFERQAILDLDLKTVGMEYASEMIVRAALHGISMAEVPVTLSPDGRDRKPHLHPWRDGWRHLRFLLMYSPRWLYLYPGLAMIIVGLLIAALLVPGPMMIADGVGLDVHTLLVGAMSILVGLQSITFGIMARSYAKRNGMIPGCSKIDKFIGKICLEHFLIAAVALLAAGIFGVLMAVERWSAANFGALDYRDVMRILIMSMTSILAGFQLGFAAFLTGVMQIRHK